LSHRPGGFLPLLVALGIGGVVVVVVAVGVGIGFVAGLLCQSKATTDMAVGLRLEVGPRRRRAEGTDCPSWTTEPRRRRSSAGSHGDTGRRITAVLGSGSRMRSRSSGILLMLVVLVVLRRR